MANENKKPSAYEEYLKRAEKVKDPDVRLVIDLLLDIRYVFNSIDKLAKELVYGKRPARRPEKRPTKSEAEPNNRR